MNKIKSFFSKISVQIALIVSVLCISLFIVLNNVLLQQSQQSFTTIVQTIRVSPYRAPLYVSSNDPTILTFNADGTIKLKPLQEQFTELFQSSIFRVGALAVIASLIIGFLTSRLFTRPLKDLQNGLNKLRDNNYKTKLEKTGTEELDSVIDDFNRLTEELKRVETLRKDLISDTSHELKTPLTSLLGQLQGVKDGVLELDEKRINSLIDQVDRLNNLVEKLQEFSRIRNKNYKLNLEKANLCDIVEEIVSQYQDKFNRNQINVTIDIPHDFKLKADKGLLKQIFINLIENTLKYAKASEIKISFDDNKLIFEDNGIGVSKEHLPYLFERFYRVEKSRNRNTGGLGLGLAIVKEIVETHSWKIEVKSEENKGTKFVIEI